MFAAHGQGLLLLLRVDSLLPGSEFIATCRLDGGDRQERGGMRVADKEEENRPENQIEYKREQKRKIKARNWENVNENVRVVKVQDFSL